LTSSTIFAQPIYKLASWLLLPVVAAHLLYRSLRDGKLIYFKQRLGFAIPQLGSVIWLHAASVGEVNTARCIIRALSETYPDTPFLISTNTPTGLTAIQKEPIANVHAIYLPLDYASAINRFKRQNHLVCGIIVETEIWPMLFELVNTPLVIINGRVSTRTLRATQRKITSKVYRRAVSRLVKVYTRSDTDAHGFAQLGVDPSHVKTLGNLKFAAAGERNSAGLSTSPLPSDYCLLASTHADEEHWLCREWLMHARSEVLVIAPRHPDRRLALIRQLKSLGKPFSVRSREEQIHTDTVFYLADTLGEMQQWYTHAKSIFLGGSLVAKGGHNMIEPAYLKKSVVIGPHYSNFKAEVEVFSAKQAIDQVDDAKSAVHALITLADTPGLADQRGQAALQVVAQFDSILEDYVSEINTLIRQYLVKD